MTQRWPILLETDADEFDPEFYQYYYKDLNKFTIDEARRHFDETGWQEGRASSVKDLIQRHPRSALLPDDFDIASYLANNPDLIWTFNYDWEFLYHYIELGHSEARSYSPWKIDPGFIKDLYGIEVGKFDDVSKIKSQIYTKHDPRYSALFVSAAQLLMTTGINHIEFLNKFEYEYYFYTQQVGNQKYRENLNAKCLMHFCTTGVQNRHNFSTKYSFDPDFWTKTRLSSDSFPSAPLLEESSRAYLHWICTALPDNIPGDARGWLHRELGIWVPSMPSHQIAVYQALNPDLVVLKSDHEIAKHFIAASIKENRDGPSIDWRAGETFLARADHLATHGSSDEAQIIYRKLVSIFPNFSLALQHCADGYLRLCQYDMALHFYERVIATGNTNIWTYINASDCCKNLKLYESSIEYLHKATHKFRGDPRLRVLLRNAQNNFFHRSCAVGAAYAKIGDIESGQGEVLKAIPREARDTKRAPSRRIRSVALVANCDIPQCTLYRVEQKYEQLIKAGYEVDLFTVSQTSEYLANLHRFDSTIFYRVAGTPLILEAIEEAMQAGHITFYDIDDAIFDARIYPSPFEDYAGHISQDEYIGLALGVPLFAEAMRRCDHLIASTQPLANIMKPFSSGGEVFTHPNGLGCRHNMILKEKSQRSDVEGNPLVIFYGTGTKAHKRDFQEILEPALNSICQSYGDQVEIVVCGYDPLSGRFPTLSSRVRVKPFLKSFNEYIDELRYASISLSVLARTEFNDAKSNIKWLEAAMLGIPSVVSRNTVFEDVIIDGEDGYLCTTTEDYILALSQLIENPISRRAAGARARIKALERYSHKTLSDNIAQILKFCEPERKQRFKILFINVYYTPQLIGGATRVLLDNIREIQKLLGESCEIEVFTTVEGSTEAPYTLSTYSADGIRTTAVVPLHHSNMIAIDSNMEDIFTKFLNVTRPDIIHFHCIQKLTVSVVNAALKLSIPYFITLHDGWWISDYQFLLGPDGQRVLYDYDNPTATLFKQGRDSYERLRILKEPLLGAAGLLAVSEKFAAIHHKAGLPGVQTVENGVSTTFVQAERRGPKDRVVVAHLGGLEYHKGAWLLRYAVIAGGFQNIDVLIVDHSKSFGFTDYSFWGTTPVKTISKIEQAKVEELYSSIDVLVAPSIWDESYGLVTREALAFGCWVIASDRGSVADPIIEGKNGFVVSVEGVTDLVGRLHEIDLYPRRFQQRTSGYVALRRSQEQARDLVQLYEKFGCPSGAS